LILFLRKSKDKCYCRYMAMGLSGGEDGARHGPSLMPGGSKESYALVEEMLKKVAAQV
jgi:6-phosphogluconate dehydrogenase